jgi:hypothetical protein
VNELQTEVRNYVRPSLDSSARSHKGSAASTNAIMGCTTGNG